MKLIKINTDHYVIVDDSQIKEGDWMYNSDREPSMLQCIGKGSLRGWQKITHSTQPLYKNDFWAIQELKLSEVKELIGEVDIWQKFKEIDGSCQKGEYEHWLFESGYNRALADNKDKKYTEEDMRKAILAGSMIEKLTMIDNTAQECLEHYNKQERQIIKSLQPKTEWEVEIIDGKLKLK